MTKSTEYGNVNQGQFVTLRNQHYPASEYTTYIYRYSHPSKAVPEDQVLKTFTALSATSSASEL